MQLVPDEVTAAELGEVPARIPRAGKILGGLGNEGLMALLGMPPAEIARVTGVSEGRAAKIDAVVRREDAKRAKGGKAQPGILNLPHFLVRAEVPEQQPVIDEILGLHPATLRVRFLTSFSLTAEINYRWYGGSGSGGGVLKCCSTKSLGVAMRYDPALGKKAPFECRRKECPDFVSGNCRRQGVLQLIIPALEKAGIYNPFQYYLHGNVADGLLSAVEVYTIMALHAGFGAWQPLYDVFKTAEDRPFPGKDGEQSKSKQWVPRMLVAEWPVVTQRVLMGRSAAVAGELPAGDEQPPADDGIDDAQWEAVDDGYVDPHDDLAEEQAAQDAAAAMPTGADDIDFGIDDDFGLTPPDTPANTVMKPKRAPAGTKPGRITLPPAGGAAQAQKQMDAAREEAKAARKGDTCAFAGCGRVCTEKESKWCHDHAGQYDGKVYCFNHQRAIDNGGGSE